MIVAATMAVDYTNGDTFITEGINATGRVNFTDNVGESNTAFLREYVVLEPTGIVVVDGQRYKTVMRNVRRGERVLITKSTKWYAVGESFTLHEDAETFSSGHVNYANGEYGMDGGIYVVLEPVASVSTAPTPKSLTDELVTLVSKLAAQNVALDKRVTSLEANVAGHEQQIGAKVTVTAPNGIGEIARKLADALKRTTSGATPTAPSLTRQDVIDRAKADVADRFEDYGDGFLVIDGYSGHNKVEFIVNSEKRTVVAILRLAYAGTLERNVRGRGKSRCSADDVFNVHIGKAIAVRRALGLTVPDVYTNAPQPTKVQAGDIVYYSDMFPRLLVTDTTDAHAETPTVSIGFLRRQTYRIVDDSRLTEVAA
jgi:hypothetical protein